MNEQPPFDPDKTQEFSPEDQETLSDLIERFHREANEHMKGRAIRYEGHRYICTDISPSLQMSLEEPETKKVITIPYTREKGW